MTQKLFSRPQSTVLYLIRYAAFAQQNTFLDILGNIPIFVLDLTVQTGMVKPCVDPGVSMALPAADSWFGSSSHHPDCPYYKARLNLVSGCSGWRSADGHFINQYVQVHFGKEIVAHKLILQVSAIATYSMVILHAFDGFVIALPLP